MAYGSRGDLHTKMAERRFRDPDVRSALDELDIEDLVAVLGEPRVLKRYATTRWRPGDGKPLLADDDPAVMQAIGRCAASRSVIAVDRIAQGVSAIHDAPCPWCEYPLQMVVDACEYAVWAARYVVLEACEWRNDSGEMYGRSVKGGEYENPEWAKWDALPARERAFRLSKVVAGG